MPSPGTLKLCEGSLAAPTKAVPLPDLIKWISSDPNFVNLLTDERMHTSPSSSDQGRISYCNCDVRWLKDLIIGLTDSLIHLDLSSYLILYVNYT